MRNTKSQFFGLLAFLTVAVLVLTNGFAARIFAQDTDVDVYEQVEPIGLALEEILSNYVEEPEVGKVVEGALRGMMNSLDEHSSYISPELYEDLKQQTEGQFDGIGVSIRLDEETGGIVVFEPIEGQPAWREGIQAGDYITKIDGVSTEGMSLDEAASRIKGPRGTTVTLELVRRHDEPEAEQRFEKLEVTVKRGRIPLRSIAEVRMLDDKVGYLRLRDFKQTSADDMREEIEALLDEGMRAFVLDLRWNPGGLLTASSEVCGLFLPRHSLVTYTKGRANFAHGGDELRLRTRSSPVLPEDFPVMILTSEVTASSSEIVTGALQYYKRAIVVGDKTYGKGSVQTIITLDSPENAALRLTTAYYYTPADVNIHKKGILPDVPIDMTMTELRDLRVQFIESYMDDASLKNEQNHGAITGNEGEDSIQDRALTRAVEILNEDPVFANLIEKYHREPGDTKVAANESETQELEETQEAASADTGS